MPLYEFRCKNCGLIFEELLFYSDIEGVLCPKCTGDAERVLSTFSVSIPDEACAKLPKENNGSSAPSASRAAVDAHSLLRAMKEDAYAND